MPVICWYCDVRPLSDPELFSWGMTSLPWEERRVQVMRFRFDKDRRLCLGAGLLLAHALHQASAMDVSIRHLCNGKPVLANDPNIHFNLAHSGFLAVCAVANQPVGVDVEVLQNEDPEVMAMCFQPIEKKWVNQAEEQHCEFTRLWTRKESYLKLRGTGLTCFPGSFCVLPGEKGFPNGIIYSEIDIMGHMICVCMQQNDNVNFKGWEIHP